MTDILSADGLRWFVEISDLERPPVVDADEIGLLLATLKAVIERGEDMADAINETNMPPDTAARWWVLVDQYREALEGGGGE